jgi:hypothetical protein
VKCPDLKAFARRIGLDALERMCDSMLTSIRAPQVIMALSLTLDLRQRYQRLGAHLRTALLYPELDVGEEKMMAANDRGFADHCRRTGYQPPGAAVVMRVVERLQPLAAS